MKKIFIISFLALSLLSFKCSPVIATNQQELKDSVDMASSDWILRHQKDSLKTVIAAYQDSLWKCREDSRIVK